MRSKNIRTTSEGVLTPTKEVFKVEGSVLYQESAQAWNTIKFKREILFLYPQLREKCAKINYKMIVALSQEEIKKQIEKEKDKLPILLFLEKEKVDLS
jgi:hypothetical protein